MRARVQNGRWVLDDPMGLPEGTEVEIVTRAVAPAVPTTVDVYLDEKLREYIHALLMSACSPKYSSSPRGLNIDDETELVASVKANALRENRKYTTPADIKKVAPEVLRRYVSGDAAHAILENTPLP